MREIASASVGVTESTVLVPNISIIYEYQPTSLTLAIRTPNMDCHTRYMINPQHSTCHSVSSGSLGRHPSTLGSALVLKGLATQYCLFVHFSSPLTPRIDQADYTSDSFTYLFVIISPLRNFIHIVCTPQPSGRNTQHTAPQEPPFPFIPLMTFPIQ